MRALARMEEKGVAANVVSYSTVTGAYAQRGDDAGAERAMARMELMGARWTRGGAHLGRAARLAQVPPPGEALTRGRENEGGAR